MKQLMNKMMMAAGFTAMVATAFGWLPENDLIKDDLAGFNNTCGKFQISSAEALFHVILTNAAEIVCLENALYPESLAMPMDEQIKWLRKRLDEKYSSLDEDLRAFARLQRMYAMHLRSLKRGEENVRLPIEGEMSACHDSHCFAREKDLLHEIVVPLFKIRPPATLDDAIDYLEQCMNCTCPEGHDGKGRLRIIREYKNAIEGGDLSQTPVPVFEAHDIQLESLIYLLCSCVGCKWEWDNEERILTISAVEGCCLPRNENTPINETSTTERSAP